MILLYKAYNGNWISNTTRDLIGKKRAARLNQDKAQYKKLSKECRKQVRQDRQTWADTLALEGEERLNSNKCKKTVVYTRVNGA